MSVSSLQNLLSLHGISTVVMDGSLFAMSEFSMKGGAWQNEWVNVTGWNRLAVMSFLGY